MRVVDVLWLCAHSVPSSRAVPKTLGGYLPRQESVHTLSESRDEEHSSGQPSTYSDSKREAHTGRGHDSIGMKGEGSRRAPAISGDNKEGTASRQHLTAARGKEESGQTLTSNADEGTAVAYGLENAAEYDTVRLYRAICCVSVLSILGMRSCNEGTTERRCE